VIVDKRILMAGGTALILFGSFSTLVLAQPVNGVSPNTNSPLGQTNTAPNNSSTTPGQGSTSTGAGDKGGSLLSNPNEGPSNFERDRNISVLQRPHEGYQAMGLHTGAFYVYPKISVTAEHNDNIYAADTAKKSDTIWRITPEVAANSNWSRHGIQGYARAVINRYQDFSTENTNDYGLGASGRLDVLRKANVNGGVDYARLTEPRTSPNSPAAALKPARYDLTSAHLGAEREFNRLRISGRYNFQKFSYDNPPKTGGGFVDQTYRDRDVNSLMGRVDYAVSPDTAVFFELAGNKRSYDRKPPAVDLNRNSKGVQGLVGANFEIGPTTRGEVAVGYFSQSFDDARLKDIKGFGARAQVEWFPTQLTTVTVAGGRTIEDSASPGAGAYLSSNISAQVDHELLRNVIITGQAAYGNDQYKVIGRTDHRATAGVSATYLLNRVVGLTASYNYSKQTTVRGVGSPFTVNKVAATLTAQF
jgi:hypothetical protein